MQGLRATCFALLGLACLTGCGASHEAASGPSTGGSAAPPEGGGPLGGEGGPDAMVSSQPDGGDGALAHPMQDAGDTMLDASIDAGSVELPPCTITPGDHAAARCDGAACPVITDVVLDCGDWEFAAPGLRVAATPSDVALYTTSSDRALVLTASGAEGELRDLPASMIRTPITLSQEQDGTVVLSGDSSIYDSTTREITGGPFILADTRSAWTEVPMPLPTGMTIRLYDFEIDPSGTAHHWFEAFTPAGPDGFRHSTRTSAGTWNLETITAGNPGSYTRWTLDRDETPIGFSYNFDNQDISQLETRIADVDEPFGSSFPFGAYGPYHPLSPAVPAVPAPADGVPAFAAVLSVGDAIRIVWPSDTEPGYEEFDLQAQAYRATCFSPAPPNCGPDCTELAEGFQDFAVAQTSDGLLWIVWSELHSDIAFHYTNPCGTQIFDCFCGTEIVHDNSTATLHVASFDFATRELQERLTLPMRPIDLSRAWVGFDADNRFLDARAFGDQLAIGARIRGDIPGEYPTQAVRLLQIDTSAL